MSGVKVCLFACDIRNQKYSVWWLNSDISLFFNFLCDYISVSTNEFKSFVWSNLCSWFIAMFCHFYHLFFSVSFIVNTITFAVWFLHMNSVFILVLFDAYGLIIIYFESLCNDSIILSIFFLQIKSFNGFFIFFSLGWVLYFVVSVELLLIYEIVCSIYYYSYCDLMVKY